MTNYTKEQLERALIQADKAGDEKAAATIYRQLQSGYLRQPRNNESADSKPLGNPLDLAKGLKSGFDKAAYAVADLAPDAPIPDESRDKWNNHLLVKALGLAIPDREQRQAEIAAGKQEAEKTTLGGAGRFVGEIAPAVAAGPSTAGAGLLRAGLTQGGLAYLTTPGDAATRGISGALAGVGEGVGRFIPKTIARGFQPIIPNASAQRFIDQGNIPTLGAAIGPSAKKIEEASASMPGVSKYVNAAYDRGLADANRLAMERGGLKVSQAGFVGQRELTDQLNELFGDILPRINFDIQDPAFSKGVQQIIRDADLDAAGVDEINRFIANRVANSGLDKNSNKVFSGKDLQAFLEDIQQRQSDFSGAKGFEARIGEAYKGLNSLVDDLVAKQNPADVVDQYRNVRRIYADTIPAIKAGEMATTMRKNLLEQGGISGDKLNSLAPEGGFFTPETYGNSLVKNARARGRISALRQGKDRNQQFANDFYTLYGNRYQDSGTATRSVITGLALTGLGAFGAHEAGYSPYMGGLGTAGSLLLLSGLAKGAYSPNGTRLLLGNKWGFQKPTADLLRKMAPASGTAGAALLPANIEEQ